MLDKIISILPSRLLNFSLIHALSSYTCNSKKEYRKNSNITDEDFFTILICVLNFIEEKELAVEKCDYPSILSFVTELCDRFGFNVSAVDLTGDVLITCLQNSGCGHSFQTCIIDKSISFKFIEDEIDETNHVVKYKLTQLGRKLLYSSYEYEEIGQISIRSLILQKQIKAGNFVKAKDSADILLLDLHKEKNKLEKYKRDIITDSVRFSAEDIISMLNSEYSTFEKIDEELLYLEGIIHDVLIGNFDKINVQKTYILDCVSIVSDISEKIKKIIILNQELMSKIKDIRETYKNQLFNTDFLLPKKYVNIEKEVLEVMVQNPDTPFDLHSLISPLLQINSFAATNPNHIMREQALVIRDDKETVDIEDDDDIISDYNDDVEKTHRYYAKMMENLIKLFNNKKQVMLSELNDNDFFAKDDLQTFKFIISLLVGQGSITFSSKKEKQTIIKVFNPCNITQFSEDIQKVLLNKTLKTAFVPNKQVTIYGKTENGKREKYSLNDVEFSLVEKE